MKNVLSGAIRLAATLAIAFPLLSFARNIVVPFDDSLVVIHRYSVFGTVTTQSGPLPIGITVSASDANAVAGNASAAHAIVGSSGQYALDLSARGSYRVTLSLAGCQFTPADKQVDLAAGVDVKGVDFVASCGTFSISGNLAAEIVPSNTRLSINGVLSTLQSGPFVVNNLLPGSYTVNVFPGPTGAECTVSPSQSQVTLGPNASGLNFTMSCPLYTISGAINGNLPGTRFATINGASYAADATFKYSSTFLAGSYTVTPQLPPNLGCVSTPPSRTVTVGPAQTGSDFQVDCPVFNVGGHVTVSPMPTNLKVSVGTQSATVQPTGDYRLSGVYAGTYNIQPSRAGCTFTPPNASVTVGPDSLANNFAASCTAVVSGTAGIGGATVVAGSKSVVSAGDGSFSLVGLAPGSYVVRPTKAQCTFSPASSTITVGTDDVSGIVFSASCTYTASGNAGIAAASVVAGSTFAIAASDGSFSVPGLAPGSYTFTPSKSQCVFTPASRAISVVAGDVAGINFGASCTYNLSGNASTRGAAVTLTSQGNKTTADDGSFSYSGLPPGSYTLSFFKPGCTFTPASQTIVLGPNSATGLSINASCSHSISGNAGIVGALISAGGRTATSDAAGNYQITGVLEGSIAITAARNGCTFLPQNVTIAFYADEAGRNFAANCGAGSYVLSGSTGQSGTLVSATSGGNTYIATADGQGNYTFPRLPQATFSLTASKPNCQASPAQTSVVIPATTTQSFAVYCPPLPTRSVPNVTLGTDVLKSIRQVKTSNGGYVFVYEVDISKVSALGATSSDPYWWQYYRSFWDSSGRFLPGGTGDVMNSGANINFGPLPLSTYDSDWVSQSWSTVSQNGDRVTSPAYFSYTKFDTRDPYPVRTSTNSVAAVYLQHHIRGNIGTWYPTWTTLGPAYFERSTPSNPVFLSFTIQTYVQKQFAAVNGATSGATSWEYVMPGEVKPTGWAFIPLDPWVVKDGRGVQWVVVKPAGAPMPFLRNNFPSPTANCAIPGAVGEFPAANQTPCIIDPKLWLPLTPIVVSGGVCRQSNGDPFPGLSDQACGMFADGTYDYESIAFQFAALQIAYGGDSQPDGQLAGHLYRVDPSGAISELSQAEAIAEFRANRSLIMNGSLNSLDAAQRNAIAYAQGRDRPVVLIYLAQDIHFPKDQGAAQVVELAALKAILEATVTAGDQDYQVAGHSWSAHLIMSLTRSYANVSTFLVNPAQRTDGDEMSTFTDGLRQALGNVCIVAGVTDWVSTFGGGQFPPDGSPCSFNATCKLQQAVNANSQRVRQFIIGDRDTHPVGHGFIDMLNAGAGAYLNAAQCN